MTKEENALLIAQKEYDKTLKNSLSWEEIEQEGDEICEEEINYIFGMSFVLSIVGTFLAIFLASIIWLNPSYGCAFIFALGSTTLLMFVYSSILDALDNHLKNKKTINQRKE